MKGSLNAYGPLRGVTMVLNVEPSDYLPRFSEQDTLVVSLQHVDEMARPEIRGFSIAPGMDTRMALHTRQFIRMPFPYGGGNCGNDEDAQYLTAPKVWQQLVNGTSAKYRKSPNKRPPKNMKL